MSLKTITYRICDGCRDWRAGVMFASYFEFGGGGSRLDLCVRCDELGLFICVPCEAVHRHETECPFHERAAEAVAA